MFERTLKGGPIKGRGIRGEQGDTPAPGSQGSRAPQDSGGGEEKRGFVKNFAARGRFAPSKPEDEAQPEGWTMGPIARLGARRLREPGLQGRGF